MMLSSNERASWKVIMQAIIKWKRKYVLVMSGEPREAEYAILTYP